MCSGLNAVARVIIIVVVVIIIIEHLCAWFVQEVLEAIADAAFKVSEYPVILSFENHCS